MDLENSNSSGDSNSFTSYDETFVELLKALDPSEVTSELLEATNAELLKQETKRSKWRLSRRQLEDEINQNNDEEKEQEVLEKGKQEGEDDDDDGLNVSDSDSSVSSDDDDDDDNNNNDRQEEEEEHHEGDDVATAFSRSFLAPDGAVEHFVRDVRATARTLQSLRSTIRRFAQKIDGVASEVGVLQRKARDAECALVNTHNVRQLTSAATDALVPSLDMARVLENEMKDALETSETGTSTRQTQRMAKGSHSFSAASSELHEISNQYVHSVRILERLLQARQSTVISLQGASHSSVTSVAPTNSSSSSSSVSATAATSGSSSGLVNKKNDTKKNLLEEEEEQSGMLQQRAHSSSSNNSSFSSNAGNYLMVDLIDSGPNLLSQSNDVVDALARQTALQIRNFLVPRIAAVIGKPRTNIAIQQRSALMPYRSFVRFLKTSCVSSRSHHQFKEEQKAQTTSATGTGAGENQQQQENNNNGTVSPSEAATLFLEEVRATYIHYASCVYVTNFQTYISECVSLQENPLAPSPSPSSSGSTSSSSATGAAGGQQLSSQAQSQQQQNQSSSSSWFDASSWFGGSTSSSSTSQQQQQQQMQKAGASFVPPFPKLTSENPPLPRPQISPGIFSRRAIATISSMHKLLNGYPILPLVQRQSKKTHSCLETFRSIHLLLCDVVTSEFLFTFEFFDGDTDVCVGVFKPIIHTLMHFVSLNFIPHQQQQQQPANQHQKTGHQQQSVPLSRGYVSETDLVSLWILTLMIIYFRDTMHSRGLHILDEYFSHVLTMLLPCTKRAMELQHLALSNMTFASGLSLLLGPHQQQELLARVKAATTPSSSNQHNNNNAGLLRQQQLINMMDFKSRLKFLAKVHPISERVGHLLFSLRSVFLRLSNNFNDEEEEGDKEGKKKQETKNSIESENDESSEQTKKRRKQQQNRGRGRRFQHSASSLLFLSSSSKNKKSEGDHKNDDGDEEDDDDDDSEQMLLVLSSGAKALNLDFVQWLRTFSRGLVSDAQIASTSNASFASSGGYSPPTQQNSNNNNQSEQQVLLLPVASVFLINNIGAILSLWTQLGFSARSAFTTNPNNNSPTRGENNQQKEENEDEAGDNNAENNNEGDGENDFEDSYREAILSIDDELFSTYEAALDSFSYEVLQHFISKVITAVRETEMASAASSSSLSPSTSTSAAENNNNTPATIPKELESAAKWFSENAKQILKSVAEYCKSAISVSGSSESSSSSSSSLALQQVRGISSVFFSYSSSSSSSSSGKTSFEPIYVSPLVDAMKRTFTQLILWNTRLHSALGAFFTATRNQTKFRSLTVSNVQLQQWMQSAI